jgi:hypothetical protein
MSRTVFLCLLAVGAAIAQGACSPSQGGAAQASALALPAPPGAAAPSAAAPATAASKAGPRAESETYDVALQPPASAKVGQPATARVVVTARAPYHVNREYPMAFRPDASATAAFDGERVALGEGAEPTPCTDHPGEACTLSAPLRFTPRAAGEARLAGTVAFSVCNPERCLIEKVALAATVDAR